MVLVDLLVDLFPADAVVLDFVVPDFVLPEDADAAVVVFVARLEAVVE